MTCHPNSSCEPGSVVWPERLGSWNPDQICQQLTAVIFTKRSSTREKWTQLTQLFTFMTPHMHFHSHSLVFSSAQKDDKMSNRLAELITESATATKGRCVLYAYNPSARRSSSISINPMPRLAGRDPDQDTNRVDSHNSSTENAILGKKPSCSLASRCWLGSIMKSQKILRWSTDRTKSERHVADTSSSDF